MSVSFDAFLHWCEDRFDGNLVVNGDEIRINSIFTEDQKHHMWCSPSGGKHHREDGCYRCFYTEQVGTLVGLVMHIDQCSYNEAKEILSGEIPIGELEDALHKFFEEKQTTTTIIPKEDLVLPEGTVRVDEVPEPLCSKVQSYLNARKLPIEKLLYCHSKDYSNRFRDRLVIPYYDKTGKLVYFNTRAIGKKGDRYKFPNKNIGVGKGDVLYTPHWPPSQSKIYLTEGELDALSLYTCGFNGFACGGKSLTDSQIDMIKNYQVCLSLDADKAGKNGLVQMANALLAVFVKLSYVRPPKIYKDWNAMLIASKPEIVKGYIKKCEKSFDPLTLQQLMCF